MATAPDLRDDLKYDFERIPLPGDEKASTGALAVLDELGDAHATVGRTIAYANPDGDCGRVRPTDLLRTLQHADGRLALVTWSNSGITSIGYRPDEQRFDVGGYSAMREMMGDESEYHERTTLAKARDLLAWTKPDVVLRDECDLLPASEGGR